MPSQSPYADFFDLVFTSAAPDLQDAFLRQLFANDAFLCASFWAYINPQLRDISLESVAINAAASQIQRIIKEYRWSVLFDTDPLAEDYSEELNELIAKNIISANLNSIENSCKTGDLLAALINLRVIEQGINLDWEKIEEPAGYYGPEVKMHTGWHFNFFINCFLDNIFSEKLIENAITWAQIWQSLPGEYFDFSKEWGSIVEILITRNQSPVF
jgi:hypothetical protein